MIYVFFDWRKEKLKNWKSPNLEKLKTFISNQGIKTDWIEFEEGDNKAISPYDNNLFVEIAKGTEKSLEEVPLI